MKKPFFCCGAGNVFPRRRRRALVVEGVGLGEARVDLEDGELGRLVSGSVRRSGETFHF